MRRTVFVAGALSVALAWGLAAGTPDRSAVAPVPDRPQRSTLKLGGVALPYSGEGIVGYDYEQQQWSFLFPAPEGWRCTHVGWEFDGPAPEAVPFDPNQPYWTAAGYLDIDVVEQTLWVRVFTADAAYAFAFAWSPELADPAVTLVPGGPGPQPRVADDQCPGGSCSCGQGNQCGGCTACCSSGFHPQCQSCGRVSCSCGCFRNVRGSLHLIPAPRPQ